MNKIETFPIQLELQGYILLASSLTNQSSFILTNQSSAFWTNQNAWIWSLDMHEDRPIWYQGRDFCLYKSFPFCFEEHISPFHWRWNAVLPWLELKHWRSLRGVEQVEQTGVVWCRTGRASSPPGYLTGLLFLAMPSHSCAVSQLTICTE